MSDKLDFIASSCIHQFFEICKTQRHICKLNGGKCTSAGDLYVQCFSYEHGVVVGCIFCNQRRYLWRDGQLEIKYEHDMAASQP